MSRALQLILFLLAFAAGLGLFCFTAASVFDWHESRNERRRLDRIGRQFARSYEKNGAWPTAIPVNRHDFWGQEYRIVIGTNGNSCAILSLGPNEGQDTSRDEMLAGKRNGDDIIVLVERREEEGQGFVQCLLP